MASYVEGRDGWLFLNEDRNNTWDQFTGVKKLSEQQITDWRSETTRRKAAFEALGVCYRFVVAPNKESILPEFLPEGYERGATTVLDQVRTLGDSVKFIDVHREFLKCPNRHKLYSKTDTHWNDFGGICASRQILKELEDYIPGRHLDENELAMRPLEGIGDLGDKMSPVRRELIDFWDYDRKRQSLEIFNNNVINHGKVVAYEGGHTNGVRLLIFGDSFSGRLVHWLRECVSRLVWVHSTAVDLEVVVHEHPSVVLSVVVERFLIRPPDSCLDFSLRRELRNKLAGQSFTANRPQATGQKGENSLYEEMMIDARLRGSLQL